MKTTIFPGTINGLLNLLLTTSLYYLFVRLGLTWFSFPPGNINLLSLSSGIGLVMCLLWGVRAFPFIVMATFAAHFPLIVENTFHHNSLYIIVASLIMGGESVFGMLLMRRFLPYGVSRPHHLLKFLLLLCGLVPALSALLIGTNLLLNGYIEAEKFIDLYITLLIAHALGILLIYQVFTGFAHSPAVQLSELNKLWSGAAIIGLIVILAATVYGPLIFLLLPVMVMMAIYLKLVFINLFSSLCFVIVISIMAFDNSVFLTNNYQFTLTGLIAYIFSSALAVFVIAIQQNQINLTMASRQAWKKAAERDPLTCLSNRRAFMPRLKTEHARAVRTGRSYCLVIWDIDDFKLINDTYGHDYGDVVLKKLADILRDNCRDIDFPARIGGEEFAVILPECSSEEGELALERFRSEVESTRFIAPDGKLLQITISIGIASFKRSYKSEMALMSDADKALYQAKSQGKNQIHVF
ncbi:MULTISPECIES: diguanylate cyclase [unclassified Methylophaga]|uniref:sensor domain-containing diguanylate cyclase n=1 Tax=unclassified Methylophaga TaxID=2629249 RepID=UPI0025E35470|nr:MULTISPECIES: diguanylate cyclase [unclassified Methylophaga]